MKLNLVAASLMTLALFAGGGVAPMATAQEAPAAEAAPAAVPEEVMNLINDRRTAQELSDDDLKARASAARKAVKAEGVPDDLKAQLQALLDADRAELETRAASAEKPAEPAPEKPAEAAAPQPEAQPEAQPEVQQAAPEVAPAPAELPADVTELLNDTRTLDQLSIDELKARAKFARKQSKNDALPEDVRQKLAAIGQAAREAAIAMEPPPAPEKKAEEPAPQPEAQPVQEQAKQPEPAPVIEQPVEPKAAEQAPPPAPAVDKVEVKELDGNAGNPEAEQKAKAFLDDTTPADSLSDVDLRARLDGMRDLMAENELSVKTERALRNKLRAERDVLRERVAKVKAEEEAKVAAARAAEQPAQPAAAPEQGKKRPKINFNIIINADTPTREILRDQREADVLDESELRYRIRARREFEATPQFREYDEEQRQEWRDRTRNDREFLGRRLREDRNIRRVELDKPANIRRIVIEDDAAFADEDLPEDVFAAEVEDGDIERALLAPPRKRIARRISVEEIADSPKIRQAMTRIEIDTIRFGFNEAFVREEEVDSLDELASVIERVLKKYPREVFLIEGHTDAVGSDGYNNKLSKARAEAVKKALSTYYIIPAKNLKTVGLGERYLKIPTAEAEQENRRVSISRATAVVGEAED
jgi:outer membrane protein OmpA-like peptidoglycan-associated protein